MEDGIFGRHAVFHPPSSILHLRFLFFLALAVFISGCTPAGPRALLAGKKLLERGDYAGAVAQLKIAAKLLATNAAAWNYYGVALQHAGQPADAAQAYQNALKFDRDLVEAHYNLGCLRLEQNQPDAARTEFTAYTLRRGNTPEGWLKLGAAQLKLHDLLPAEKSFSTALSLNHKQRRGVERPRPGARRGRSSAGRGEVFLRRRPAHPDYAPALLNLATVDRQYLRDDAQALKNYRAYLALTPRPADWDAVNDLVKGLEQPAMVAAVKAPPAMENETTVPAKPNAAETKPPPTAAAHPSLPPKAQPGGRNTPAPPRPATPAEDRGSSAGAGDGDGAQCVRAGNAAGNSRGGKTGGSKRLNPGRRFGSSTQSENYTQSGVTPLPPAIRVRRPPRRRRRAGCRRR